jgi:hypothetical protein
MKTHKIAVFYLIGQFREWWIDEFYNKQINLLHETGLYDEIDFVDIHVSGGKQALPFVPDKIRNISYHSVPFQEENETFKSIWEFCSNNPGYKVLFFHSHGITHFGQETVSNKIGWKQYMEDCTIRLWKECYELLDFYDCVGADYRYFAAYRNDEIVIKAPHYPGMFWWANSNYIKSIDPSFLDQNVLWKRFLGELFIGAGNPKQHSINMSDTLNFYNEKVRYDLEKIKRQARNNIDYFRQQAIVLPSLQDCRDII